MKKILIVMLLLAAGAANAQIKIDTTGTRMVANDTAYTAVNNVCYREIHYLYTINKKPMQAYIKDRYDGAQWVFYQLREEEFHQLFVGYHSIYIQ